MALAAEYELTGIAFPAISCGVYGYPRIEAAAVAIAALRESLRRIGDIDVVLCGYTVSMSAILQQALNAT